MLIILGSNLAFNESTILPILLVNNNVTNNQPKLFNAIPQRLYVNPCALNPASPGTCPKILAAIVDTPTSDLADGVTEDAIKAVIEDLGFELKGIE